LLFSSKEQSRKLPPLQCQNILIPEGRGNRITPVFALLLFAVARVVAFWVVIIDLWLFAQIFVALCVFLLKNGIGGAIANEIDVVDTHACKNQIILLLQVVLTCMSHYLESAFKKPKSLFDHIPET
jgi:hypothetical protein